MESVYVVLIVLAVLSVVGFFIKAERTVKPKLFKFLSWIIIIGFGVYYTLVTLDGGDPFEAYAEFLAYELDTIIVMSISEFIILLILNMISIKNKVKAVILTISQVALTLLSFFIALLAVLIIILVFVSGKGDTVKKVVNRKSYTEQEDIYAKANGFYDAETANASGFSTKEANQPGFDFTKKREY